MRTFLKKINPMLNIPNTHKASDSTGKIITTIPIDNNCTDDIY